MLDCQFIISPNSNDPARQCAHQLSVQDPQMWIDQIGPEDTAEPTGCNCLLFLEEIPRDWVNSLHTVKSSTNQTLELHPSITDMNPLKTRKAAAMMATQALEEILVEVLCR